MDNLVCHHYGQIIIALIINKVLQGYHTMITVIRSRWESNPPTTCLMITTNYTFQERHIHSCIKHLEIHEY